MKKLLLLVTFACVTLIDLNAQTTISQTGDITPTSATVSCRIFNSQGQTTGVYESSYYRSYTMTAATKIVSVKVGNLVNLVTGVNSFPITVKLHKSNGIFPSSFATGLTQIATVDKSLSKSTADSQGNLIPATETIDLTTPVAVAVGDVIVVEVTHATISGGLFLMGVIDPTGTATGTGYIKGNDCNYTTPIDISTIPVGGGGTGNDKIVLDLVENASVSSEKFFTENFNLYPNPTSDVLNISSKNGLEMKEIKITDLSGRIVRTLNNSSTINVSDFSAGTYLIDITTNEGKASSKFIKK